MQPRDAQTPRLTKALNERDDLLSQLATLLHVAETAGDNRRRWDYVVAQLRELVPQQQRAYNALETELLEWQRLALAAGYYLGYHQGAAYPNESLALQAGLTEGHIQARAGTKVVRFQGSELLGLAERWPQGPPKAQGPRPARHQQGRTAGPVPKRDVAGELAPLITWAEGQLAQHAAKGQVHQPGCPAAAGAELLHQRVLKARQALADGDQLAMLAAYTDLHAIYHTFATPPPADEQPDAC